MREELQLNVESIKIHRIFVIGISIIFLAGCAGPRGQRLPQVSPKYEKRAELKPVPSRITVIDPGHGGKEPGAIGPTGLKEKDVVLDIAKRLEKLLSQRNYHVILTRKGDYDVSLLGRREIACDHKADLFISIHCDGNRNQRWNGTAVYILSEEGSEIVTQRAFQDDKLISSVVGDSSSDDTLSHIVLDLVQRGAARESYCFAEIAIRNLAQEIGTNNLGIKRRGFAVLKTPHIPSVLVEAAFITNWWEEKLLKQPSFRQRIAEALSKSVEEYFSGYGE